MRRLVIWLWLISAVMIALFAISGCGRRLDPVAVEVSGEEGSSLRVQHDFEDAGLLPPNGLGLTLTESPLRISRTYVPPGYRPRGQGRPYPVLFLLLDFGGNGLPISVVDEDYYFEVGLRQIVDSLINAGVIKPMIIATIDLYNAYGGSWYASNFVQGLYADAFVNFVQYTDTAVNASSREYGRIARGIAGVGMGGYGAMVLALQRPDLFSSVSSVNGHLAFAQTSDRHDFNGITDWVPKVFEENFVTPVPAVDTMNNPMALLLLYYSMTPDINLPLRKPYTNLVFSMAAAFSPFDPSTATFADSATWMNAAVVGGPAQNYKVSLPFTWDGEIWPDVFGKWLAYDATQFLLDFASNLANTAVHVEAGTSSEFNILAQNRIFRDAAMQRGVPDFEYTEYDGYTGYPTTGRHLLAERLRVILQFHSENIFGPETTGP